jgi:hypothetical protein
MRISQENTRDILIIIFLSSQGISPTAQGGAYLVGVLNPDPEFTRFQLVSLQITTPESVVLWGFCETPTGLGREKGWG